MLKDLLHANRTADAVKAEPKKTGENVKPVEKVVKKETKHDTPPKDIKDTAVKSTKTEKSKDTKAKAEKP